MNEETINGVMWAAVMPVFFCFISSMMLSKRYRGYMTWVFDVCHTPRQQVFVMPIMLLGIVLFAPLFVVWQVLRGLVSAVVWLWRNEPFDQGE